MIDSILLAAARILSFDGARGLTNASGFYFRRDERLFLVTSRHVVVDEPSKHYPSHLEIELHTSGGDMGKSIGFSVPLYRDGKSVWRQGSDSGGEIDIAVIELERAAMPTAGAFEAFTPAHLVDPSSHVQVGSSLLVVGYPLGFHDTLHHLPVVRQAVVASAFGLRFQGQGFFLTDARTHRGTSGAAVVMHDPQAGPDAVLPWKLLGVHSARMDMSNRDLVLDESLGLNCAWYADMLLKLTET
jgi:S1-C subfamily serine protease